MHICVKWFTLLLMGRGREGEAFLNTPRGGKHFLHQSVEGMNAFLSLVSVNCHFRALYITKSVLELSVARGRYNILLSASGEGGPFFLTRMQV